MITLALKEQPTVPLEAESLSPDVMASLDHDAIRALPVLLGKRRHRLEDFFDVEGAASDQLAIRGDLRKVKWIGRGMTRGRIGIVGDVGMHLGASMKGGTIEVTGNVSDWLGAEMTGGLIRIRGNAGGQVGAAYRGSPRGMNQGTILIEGSAGIEVGMRMRRGIIVVAGPVRDFAGLEMKGGTIFLLGGAEIRTGAWTIKLATLLSVLEKGTSKIDDMVEVGSAGRAPVGSKIVTDAERSPRPVLSVKDCFAHSSNVGMSKLAYKAFAQNPEELKEYLHRFHLDTRSPIDLSNVPKPTMAPLNEKGSAEGNMLWMSFGYGLQVSPLHTLSLYNAVANNGAMMKPYLVSSVQSNGIITKQFEPTVIEKTICSPAVIAAARTAMEATVTDGTATRAFKGVPFSIAGKTGTAHVSDGAIKYAHGVYQASFVGYFPADNPQYSCIVVIRTKPHAASHYGGTLAAPVFREIATKLHAMYVNKKTASLYAAVKDSSAYFYAGAAADIRKVLQELRVGFSDSASQHNWSSVYAYQHQPVVKPVATREGTMPNVRGMGLKDAIYLLENMGVKVSVRGKGKVTTQSISPGSQLAKGITVILELS